jgi:hypothetical protein
MTTSGRHENMRLTEKGGPTSQNPPLTEYLNDYISLALAQVKRSLETYATLGDNVKMLTEITLPKYIFTATVRSCLAEAGNFLDIGCLQTFEKLTGSKGIFNCESHDSKFL